MEERNLRIDFRQLLPIHGYCVRKDPNCRFCSRPEVLQMRSIDRFSKREDQRSPWLTDIYLLVVGAFELTRITAHGYQFPYNFATNEQLDYFASHVTYVADVTIQFLRPSLIRTGLLTMEPITWL